MLCLVCVAVFAAACTGPAEPAKPLFTFTGSVEISGKEYDVTLNGKEDNNFELVISGIPVPLEGKYEFVSGKGYILDFYDAGDTSIKTRYSETKKEFYFYYDLNLGSAIGGGTVRMSLKDEGFLTEYDHEDWGWPFQFYGEIPGVLISGNDCTLTVICNPDGSAYAIGSSPMISLPARSGTWEYDAETKVYTFDLAGHTQTVYTSTYDEETNTWTVSIHFDFSIMWPLTATYTPAIPE
jgi:hypothetical protein